MSDRSLLLVGGDSEIGSAVFQSFRAEGLSVLATTRRRDRVEPARPFLDLAAPIATWDPPPGIAAACIFAGIPRILACNRDPTGTARINVTQTTALAEALLRRGIYVLFLSTNQVFDGTAPRMPAHAPLAPVSEYGRQKARVEARLSAFAGEGAPAAVLRFGKVVTAPMALIQSWARDLAAKQTVSAFADMMMAPTPVACAVAAIRQLMAAQAIGVFQLTGPEDVSYADIAQHVARRIDAPPTLVRPVPAATTEAGLPQGATPRHTTLDSTTLAARWGIVAPDPWTVIETLF